VVLLDDMQLRQPCAVLMERPKQRDAKIVRARAPMVEAQQTVDELLSRKCPDDDCESVPGFLDLEARRWKVLADLQKLPAQSFEVLRAKTEALVDRELVPDYQAHGKMAVSLANDVLRYFGAGVG
jgi:hypothetical protein